MEYHFTFTHKDSEILYSAQHFREYDLVIVSWNDGDKIRSRDHRTFEVEDNLASGLWIKNEENQPVSVASQIQDYYESKV